MSECWTCDELRAEVSRLKLSMLAHFNEEHLAGDGPEIDRWKREVARLEAAHAYSEASFKVAEAEVARLREENARLACAAAGLKQCCEEQRAEVARLRSVPDRLQRPDADLLRSLPGDQVTEDRYWIGWTDALDQVRAALAPEAKQSACADRAETVEQTHARWSAPEP